MEIVSLQVIVKMFSDRFFLNVEKTAGKCYDENNCSRSFRIPYAECRISDSVI
jgi:hypothetical protein